ncbi:hypothetical protein GCM10008969_33660 [Pseudomonas veronii subsp. inensis]|uniref:helix-turn-helix domain-containing protein n=1 Tax=Pseudomonas veronii TaxID=76761 RepID=UPI0031F7D254
MELFEKLKLIRQAEGLTQRELCDATGINLSTWKSYELQRRKEVSSLELLKITGHPQFKKYTLWLMCDEAVPECGQISPV